MPFSQGASYAQLFALGGWVVSVTAKWGARGTGRGRGSAVKVRGVVTGGSPFPQHSRGSRGTL